MSCGRHTLGVGRKQVRREDLRRAVQLLVIAHSMRLLRAESHERVIQIEEWLVGRRDGRGGQVGKRGRDSSGKR